MRFKEAITEGLDFEGTILVRPDPLDTQLFYARFIVPLRVYAADPVDDWLPPEVEIALDDIRRCVKDGGYEITSESLWRGWAHFTDPGDLGSARWPEWDGA